MLLEVGIELIGTILEGLIMSLPTILEALPGLILTIIETIGTALLTGFPQILGAIGNFLEWLIGALASGLGTALGAVGRFILKVIEFFVTLPFKIIGAIIGMVAFVIKHFDDIKRIAGEKMAQFVSGVITFFTSLPGKIATALSEVPGKLATAFEEWVKKAKKVGKDIIDGILKGLGNLASKLKEKLLEAAGEAFDGLKSFFGIKSPSRLMIKLFSYVVEGAALGITQNTSQLVKSAYEMATKFINAIKKPLQNHQVEAIVFTNDIVALKNSKAKMLAEARTAEEKRLITEHYDELIAQKEKEAERAIAAQKRIDDHERRQVAQDRKIASAESKKSKLEERLKNTKDKKARDQLKKQIASQNKIIMGANTQKLLNEQNYKINEERIKSTQNYADEEERILNEAREKAVTIEKQKADELAKIAENRKSDLEDWFKTQFSLNGFNPNLQQTTTNVGNIIVNATTNGIDVAEVGQDLANDIFDRVDLRLGGAI